MSAPVLPPPTRRPPPTVPDAPSRHRRTRLRVTALVLCLLVLVPGTSYVRALTAPGAAGVPERSVEWVRDHGGNGLVNAIENWWYTRQAPPTTAPDAAALPSWATAGAAPVTPPATGSPVDLPPVVTALAGSPAVPGEAVWVPGRTDATGTPALCTTVLRPDAQHPSVFVGAAWMRSAAAEAHLVAGTVQPGGRGWPGTAQVPPKQVPSLLATFNSGWKYKDIAGGFYLSGRTGDPLLDGEASAVIDDTGRLVVGQWGRDVSMSPHVVAVRQNLQLVVENGSPVNGLAVNGGGRWGSSRQQLQYTWRSGLGNDAHGDLVYVAGENLTLQTLANALADAGAVTGMELDIHHRMASFSSWAPVGDSVRPTKLLPAMSRSADRYLIPDQRDFFYLTLR